MKRPVTRALRGITLVEISVAAGIATVLLTFAAFWLLGLVQISSADNRSNEVERTAARIAADFRRDVENARPCAALGQGSPVLGGTASEVYFHSDVDNDGDLDLVIWRVIASELRRGIAEGTGRDSLGACTVSPTVNWSIVAPRVRPFTNGTTGATTDKPWYFAGVNRGSSPVTFPNDPAVLTTEEECAGARAERCNFDGLAINVTVTAPDGSGPESVYETVPFNSWSTIGYQTYP